MEIQKTCEECGNDFVTDQFHPYKRFCSTRCQRINAGKKKRLGAVTPPPTPGLFPNSEPEFVEPAPIKPVSKPAPQRTPFIEEPIKRADKISPPNLDLQTQYIFNLLNKEVDRMEALANEHKAKAIKLKEENDKLRDDLATLKTEQKIQQVKSEHKKPSGLQGFTSSLQGILDNQYLGPVIAQMAGKLLGGVAGPVGELPGGTPEAQQAAMQIINWYGAQTPEVQENFGALISAIASQDAALLPATLARLVNILKGGSAVHTARATGTAGYGS